MLRAQNDVIRFGLPAGIGREAVATLRRAALVVASFVALSLTYYFTARAGFAFRFADSHIGIVWPANALLLSAFLLVPRRRWWMVVVATGIAHIAVMSPTVPAWRWTWQIAGNSGFAMLTAMLLRRYAGLPLHLGSLRQVLAYLVIAFASPALFALVTPAFVRALLGLEPAFHPLVALQRVTLTNATALLVVTPVIVLWAQHGLPKLRRLPARSLVEACIMMTALVAVAVIAFGTGPEFARFSSLLLWLFPPLLWAAVRFGPLGAATSLFCISALSMWGTARQLGPFVHLPQGEMVLSLQLLWIGLCAPVMLIAAVIREREQAEVTLQDQRNQLAHVTRVATAGELSGAIAHELRQPLMAIMANAQAAACLLRQDRPSTDELQAILDDIIQDNRHAASVISRLRAFIQVGQRVETLAVDTVVRNALALGRSTLAISGVDVETEIASTLPRVRGDPGQLLQVVLNLIVNSCESMSNVTESERRLRLRVAPTTEGQVELRVSDRGVGLPHGGEDRVFEPFFTTKNRGLGLGLAIGRSIASAHGGQLWGENNSSGGATFYLLLPTESANGGHAAVDRHR